MPSIYKPAPRQASQQGGRKHGRAFPANQALFASYPPDPLRPPCLPCLPRSKQRPVAVVAAALYAATLALALAAAPLPLPAPAALPGAGAPRLSLSQPLPTHRGGAGPFAQPGIERTSAPAGQLPARALALAQRDGASAPAGQLPTRARTLALTQRDGTSAPAPQLSPSARALTFSQAQAASAVTLPEPQALHLPTEHRAPRSQAKVGCAPGAERAPPATRIAGLLAALCMAGGGAKSSFCPILTFARAVHHYLIIPSHHRCLITKISHHHLIIASCASTSASASLPQPIPQGCRCRALAAPQGDALPHTQAQVGGRV